MLIRIAFSELGKNENLGEVIARWSWLISQDGREMELRIVLNGGPWY
jgi:hypothetical protein